MEPEKRWFGKHNALANDASSLVAQRNAHKEKAERSRTRLQAMETLAAAPGEIYQVSQYRALCCARIRRTQQHAYQPATTLVPDSLVRRLTRIVYLSILTAPA